MSLLSKNTVLQSYRRMHQEDLLAQQQNTQREHSGDEEKDGSDSGDLENEWANFEDIGQGAGTGPSSSAIAPLTPPISLGPVEYSKRSSSETPYTKAHGGVSSDSNGCSSVSGNALASVKGARDDRATQQQVTSSTLAAADAGYAYGVDLDRDISDNDEDEFPDIAEATLAVPLEGPRRAPASADHVSDSAAGIETSLPPLDQRRVEALMRETSDAVTGGALDEATVLLSPKSVASSLPITAVERRPSNIGAPSHVPAVGMQDVAVTTSMIDHPSQTNMNGVAGGGNSNNNCTYSVSATSSIGDLSLCTARRRPGGGGGGDAAWGKADSCESSRVLSIAPMNPAKFEEASPLAASPDVAPRPDPSTPTAAGVPSSRNKCNDAAASEVVRRSDSNGGNESDEGEGDWDAANEKFARECDRAEGAKADVAPIRFWEAVLLFKKEFDSLPRSQVSDPPHEAAKKPQPRPRERKGGFFGSCCSGQGDVAERSKSVSTQAKAHASAQPTPGGPDKAFLEYLKSEPLSWQHSVHMRLLYTIYYVITDADAKVAGESNGGRALSTRGVNWERIGFQGSNPATDLRATGILGLVQLLYLVDHYPLLTAKLWELCNPKWRGASNVAVEMELPFVLIGFNFTALALDALQRGLLAGAIARGGAGHHGSTAATAARSEAAAASTFPVMFACAEYYVGCMAVFWKTWMQLIEARRPVLPTVSDFGSQKMVVKEQLLSKKGGVSVAFGAAREAISPSFYTKSEKGTQ